MTEQAQVHEAATDRQISSDERCPDCGYCLRGIPADAACPECGATRDPDEIVLYGQTNDQVYVSNRPWLRYVIALVLAMSIPMIQGFAGGLFSASVWIPVTILLGVAELVLFYARRRRAKDQGYEGPVQLRLNERGFGLREGPGPVIIQPWQRGDNVKIRFPRGKKSRYLLRVRRGIFADWFAQRCLIWFQFTATPQEIDRILTSVHRWINNAAPRAPQQTGAT